MFKDHFSGHSKQYSNARPTYPDNLFDYLMTCVKGRNLAWDCATGNGQAALKLAPYFKKIMATDASKTQLDEANACANVEYKVATAENSGLDAQSVDLITVATAIHWFDFNAFYEEAKRVMKPNGLIAVWCYSLFQTDNAAFNALINVYYRDIVSLYWPTERRYIDAQYKTIPFPFAEITPVPEFAIVNQWSSNQIINYLQTWSGVKKYEEQRGKNPIEEWLLPRMVECINDFDEPLLVTMPLALRVGYAKL